MANRRLPEEVRRAAQKGKADPALKNVLALRWIIGWTVIMWVCIGWLAPIFDHMEGTSYTGWVIFLNLIIIPIAVFWATLYVDSYSFRLLPDSIEVKRGVLGRRESNITYTRIQNVVIAKGLLDRMFGIATVQIQTAGSSMPGGAYGTMGAAEGNLQGLLNPGPVAKYIMSRVKRSKYSSDEGMGDVSRDPPAVLEDRFEDADGGVLDELRRMSSLLENILYELKEEEEYQ